MLRKYGPIQLKLIELEERRRVSSVKRMASITGEL
jgi:hypothetical protein